MAKRPVTRAERKAATTKKILRAAQIMFLERGYEGVTLRELAVAVGRSTGSIFNSFRDKAALYEATTGLPPPNVVGFLRELSCRSPAGQIGGVAGEAGELLRQLVGSEGVRRFDEDAELDGADLDEDEDPR